MSLADTISKQYEDLGLEVNLVKLCFTQSTKNTQNLELKSAQSRINIHNLGSGVTLWLTKSDSSIYNLLVRKGFESPETWTIFAYSRNALLEQT